MIMLLQVIDTVLSMSAINIIIHSTYAVRDTAQDC